MAALEGQKNGKRGKFTSKSGDTHETDLTFGTSDIEGLQVAPDLTGRLTVAFFDLETTSLGEYTPRKPSI